MPELSRFIGVDGEGGTIDGVHRYLLLRIGDRALISPDRRTALSTEACLRFLVSYPVPGTLVGYGFGYDVTMILTDVDRLTLHRLFDRESRAYKDRGRVSYRPVHWRGYDLEHLPGKRFSVRRNIAGHTSNWRTVHDVIGFFQGSFIGALTAWEIAPPTELERMTAEKAQRAEFTELTDDTINYNQRECDYLRALMAQFRAATLEAGYSVTSWEGAGCLASAMLRKHSVPQPKTLPKPVEAMARAAYYGGRFEVSRVGVVPDVIEYDIASAYPYALTRLPCLSHGRWVPWQVGDAGLFVASLSWHSQRPWGPFPFRRLDGSICYPAHGNGVYWSPEIEAAQRAGDDIRIDAGWTWVPYECDCEPYSFVPDVFRERRRLGKSARGKILKLGLNSLYGKTAQSIGQPKYASAAHAGLITSLTRARMLRVTAVHGSAVVMIATDGIYLSGETLDPQLGVMRDGTAALGEWERDDVGTLFIVQPGVYFTPDGTVRIKTRGVSARTLNSHRTDIMAAWGRERMLAEIRLPVTDFIGGRRAIAMRDETRWGQWISRERLLSFGSNNLKRDFDVDGYSVPWDHALRESPLLTSTPYAKTFGTPLDELEDTDSDWWEQ